MTASFSPYVFVYFLASTLIAFRLSTTTAETGISVLSYFYFKSEFIVFFFQMLLIVMINVLLYSWIFGLFLKKHCCLLFNLAQCQCTRRPTLTLIRPWISATYCRILIAQSSVAIKSVSTLILCSHYTIVGHTVWQTVARSVHTLRRFDKLSPLRVCCLVARSVARIKRVWSVRPNVRQLDRQFVKPTHSVNGV